MKCALLLGIQRVRHRLCLRVQLTRRQLHKQIISTGYGAMPELLWEERDGERDRVRGRGGRRERERERYVTPRKLDLLLWAGNLQGDMIRFLFDNH